MCIRDSKLSIQWIREEDPLLQWVDAAAYATRRIGNDAVQIQQSLADVGQPGMVRFERAELWAGLVSRMMKTILLNVF